jgi:N-acetylglucosaminyldiphosphoundecaprenol N-acetyl-beta-D-mannosaminyltransferase
MNVERVRVGEWAVDRISMAQTLTWVTDAVARREPRQIAVINAHKCHLMARHSRLRRVMDSADLIVPEFAIVWAARRLGVPSLTQSGGLLVAKALIPYAAKTGLSLYFLGATPEAVSTTVHRVQRSHPALRIAGYHHGYFQVEAEVVAGVRDSKPDVLFVALGSPAQELWIARNKERLGVPVSIGVGGVFDVLSGQKVDAPAWARGNGIEWLYRTAQSPRQYLRRYIVTNSWFL